MKTTGTPVPMTGATVSERVHACPTMSRVMTASTAMATISAAKAAAVFTRVTRVRAGLNVH